VGLQFNAPRFGQTLNGNLAFQPLKLGFRDTGHGKPPGNGVKHFFGEKGKKILLEL